MREWQKTKLGEICQLEYGKPLPDEYRDEKGLYPAFGANGEKTRTNKFYFEKPSIIVGRKGSAGELNLTDGKFWPLDVTYFVTFDENKYDLKFLYFLLQVKKLPELARGIKPGINRNDVYNLDVLIPPLPVQKAIVAKLDAAFASIEQAITAAERNAENAKQLFQSYLSDVFEKGGDGWRFEELGNVCNFQNGFAFKSTLFTESGVPILRISNIQKNAIDIKRIVYTNPNSYKENLTKYIVEKGDLLIAMSGATTGKVGFNTTDTKFLLNQRVGKFIPKPVLSKQYLFYFLSTQVEKNLSISAGAAQPNLSTEQIKAMKLPLPDIQKQNTIASDISVLSTENEKLENIYKAKNVLLSKLKQSLLQQAFNGQLVDA